MITTMIRRWLRDEQGAAAVELALVAPVIAGLALVSFNVWRTGSENQDARAALDVGAEYYMAGGVDDAAARAAAYDGWRDRPAGASVTSSRSYRCSDTAAKADTICTGGRTPAAYVTLVATAGGAEDHTISEQRVVRVR